MCVSAFTSENAYSPIVSIPSGITVLANPKIRVLVALSIIALQLSLLSKVALSASTLIFSKLSQYSNTLSPMEVTFAGIVIFFKFVRPKNA